MMTLIGARVSTDGRSLASQCDALKAGATNRRSRGRRPRGFRRYGKAAAAARCNITA
jgi:hypothetical protein